MRLVTTVWIVAAAMSATLTTPLAAWAQASNAATATTAPAASPTSGATDTAPSQISAETAAPQPATTDAAVTQVAAAPDPSTLPAIWKASCEAGFTYIEGNSSTRSLSGACKTSRESHAWILAGNGDTRYALARLGGPTHPRGDFRKTETNYRVLFREDLFLSDSRTMYLFLTEGIGGDRFKGFSTRLESQLGYGYYFVKSDTAKLSAEVGLEYSRDWLLVANVDGDLSEDRFGGLLRVTAEKTISESAQVGTIVTFLPNLLDPQTDWRATGEGYLLLRITDRMSFKSQIVVAYDRQPSLVDVKDVFGTAIGTQAPALRTDTTWTNLLVITLW